MSKKNHSRRDVLKMGLLGGASLLGSPLNLLSHNLAQTLISQASAEAVGQRSRRFLYIQLYAAPPRWMFDLILNPKNSSEFVFNPLVATEFTSSDGQVYDGTRYKTVDVDGIHMPPIWKQNLPTGSGEKPLSEIAPNMISLRGLSTGTAGHLDSAKYFIQANSTTQSVGALANDNNIMPLAAVALGPSTVYPYRSNKKSVPLYVDGSSTQLVDRVFGSLKQEASASFKDKREKLQLVVDQAVNEVDKVLDRDVSSALHVNRMGARELFKKDVSQLDQVYQAIFNKYKLIVDQAIRPGSIPNFNDKPIGIAPEKRTGDLSYNFGNSIDYTPDLRDNVTANTRGISMAEHFAMAEYLMLNHLSASVRIYPKSLARLTQTDEDGKKVEVSLNFDQHFYGKMHTLWLDTIYYRALGGCLLELIHQLKINNDPESGKSIFEESVILFAGEFNRNPRKDGRGSDHGWNGASATFFSGAINQQQVIGDIYKTYGTGYPGTWGQGAPNSEIGNQQLTMSHLHATMAAMLRVPSPVTAASSLVNEVNGSFKTVAGVGTGKLV